MVEIKNMNKKANFCIDCKFCSHHKQKTTGWSYYCTNPKTTLYNFVDGNVECVPCGAVRQLDTNRLDKFWRDFRDLAKGYNKNVSIDELIEIYKDSDKDYRDCPLYRKKLTLMRFWKLKFLKLIRYGKKLL